MPYQPEDVWHALRQDAHDDPADTEGWAALAETETERIEDERRAEA